jgi:phage shock protein E
MKSKTLALIISLVFTLNFNLISEAKTAANTDSKNQKNELILDVRTQEEWDLGHVKGAVHIPISQVSKNIKKIQKMTKNKLKSKVIVYCASGGRAGRAKKLLEAKGFKNVVNAGGLEDMKALKYPVK